VLHVDKSGWKLDCLIRWQHLTRKHMIRQRLTHSRSYQGPHPTCGSTGSLHQGTTTNQRHMPRLHDAGCGIITAHQNLVDAMFAELQQRLLICAGLQL
jgi:hypothetical protein